MIQSDSIVQTYIYVIKSIGYKVGGRAISDIFDIMGTKKVN